MPRGRSRFIHEARDRTKVAPSGMECTKPPGRHGIPCLKGMLPYGRLGL